VIFKFQQYIISSLVCSCSSSSALSCLQIQDDCAGKDRPIILIYALKPSSMFQTITKSEFLHLIYLYNVDLEAHLIISI
jgi:hypothetical protein